jgi:hypothetical protein
MNVWLQVEASGAGQAQLQGLQEKLAGAQEEAALLQRQLAAAREEAAVLQGRVAEVLTEAAGMREQHRKELEEARGEAEADAAAAVSGLVSRSASRSASWSLCRVGRSASQFVCRAAASRSAAVVAGTSCGVVWVGGTGRCLCAGWREYRELSVRHREAGTVVIAGSVTACDCLLWCCGAQRHHCLRKEAIERLECNAGQLTNPDQDRTQAPTSQTVMAPKLRLRLLWVQAVEASAQASAQIMTVMAHML